MYVVPVIDLLGGAVVRGVAGRRAEYRPLKSLLTEDVSPALLAKVFRQDFDFRTIYIADLDAIAGQPPNLAAYRAIAESGLTLWLDAGLGNVQQVQHLVSGCEREGIQPQIIVGLESLTALDDLAKIVHFLGADRALFSLDMKSGVPMTSLASSTHHVLGQALDAGFRRIILLDLADVGVGRGTTTLPIIRALRQLHPSLEIIAGGGVRNKADLHNLAAEGCSAALVASALHDRTLTVDDLREFSA